MPSTGITVKYFNKSWSSVNIHHDIRDSWTTFLEESITGERSGWWSRTINGTSETFDFVFNNGSQWDNNLNRDYISKISYGNLILVSNRIVNVGGLYTGSAPVSVRVRCYRPRWSTVKIHCNNGSTWTTPSGEDMVNEVGGVRL